MEPFLGEIRIMPYGGNFITRGWAPCNGQLLPIPQNTALFALLGTAFGGNGTSTFGLPSLNGRLAIGPDGSTQRGAVVGTETVTIQPNEAALHAHAVSGSVPVAAGTGGSSSPAGTYFATAPAEAFSPKADAGPTATMLSGTTGPAGGSQPHENRMPYLALGYFIATQGVFPQRS